MPCAKLFGITVNDLWTAMNWTVVTFFGSNSTGSVNGGTIQFNCTGIPAVESDGLQVNGTLTYTGPAVNCKVTITGGPFNLFGNSFFRINIDHSVVGNLLTVSSNNITSSPQVFNFTIPLSVAATVTVYGGQGGNILVITQNTVVGTVVLATQ